MWLDVASITAPALLPKLTRSKGPSLHRHYPASQVPLTLSDAQMARDPFRPRSQVATLRPPRASPTDRRLPSWHAVLATPVAPSVPDGYRFRALPRRVLPNGLGLPRFSAGSASTLHLSRPAQASHAYGLPSCSPTFPWTLSRGSGHTMSAPGSANGSAPLKWPSPGWRAWLAVSGGTRRVPRLVDGDCAFPSVATHEALSC
jgi:hypothetical protein